MGSKRICCSLFSQSLYFGDARIYSNRHASPSTSRAYWQRAPRDGLVGTPRNCRRDRGARLGRFRSSHSRSRPSSPAGSHQATSTNGSGSCVNACLVQPFCVPSACRLDANENEAHLLQLLDGEFIDEVIVRDNLLSHARINPGEVIDFNLLLAQCIQRGRQS
jgi:hypothetical protein